ncbi:MAG: hypothetical protein AVDCRST_MAG70-1782, partial [uncultured Thermomicrobiales bacterium]
CCRSADSRRPPGNRSRRRRWYTTGVPRCRWRSPGWCSRPGRSGRCPPQLPSPSTSSQRPRVGHRAPG